MPIQSGDIKLVASAVMNDTTQGGGPPSANVIQDAVSNAIFPDISELDRAGGRVNMRKVFASVQTDDTDTFLGANVIVAEPPSDPNVSITLFSTENTFDTRNAAKTRVESYLTPSAEWVGILFENHISGQRVVQMFQRPNSELPVAGQTLVLVQNEGQQTEFRQYVRATNVTYEERTFYDAGQQNDYQAWIVDVSISDALRYDFTGNSPNRAFTRQGNAARIRDTNVADAGTYAGVVPITLAADIGDFSIDAESIFTQIVPSAQTETPLTDIKTNGLQNGLVSNGASITRQLTLAFTTTQGMYTASPLYPGSLSIQRDGTTLTDRGGRLLNGEAQVGTVDYESGICTLTTNVFGVSGGTHSVTYKPASTPELISSHKSFFVSAETRAQTYTFVMEPVPLPGTLSVSYLAQGRWYVLRDDKGGALAGSDSAYGVGTVNYTTGAIVVTLGALPDVGSSLVYQWYNDVAVDTTSQAELLNQGRAYIALNTAGEQSELPGDKPININGLAITWNYNGQKTANDDGFGNITGDAVGKVDYTDGVIRLSPNALPPAGTVFLFDIDNGEPQIANNVSWGGTNAGNIGVTNLIPGTIKFEVELRIDYYVGNGGYASRVADPASKTFTVTVGDDGAGVLRVLDTGAGTLVNCGTINYAAGTFTITPSFALPTNDRNGPNVTNYWYFLGGVSTWTNTWDKTPPVKSKTGTIITTAANITYATTLAEPDSISLEPTQYRIRALAAEGYLMKGTSFKLGSSQYQQLPNNTLIKDPSATTGVGTISGSVSGAASTVYISLWPTGASPVVTDWRASLCPPTQSPNSPFAGTNIVLRTAAAPLRVGSVSVVGNMTDGTGFNVTADSNGKFNGTRVKGRVDYEYGLIELFFVNPNGDPLVTHDLTRLQIPGLTEAPVDSARLSTVRYNAVAFSYLPLDADILGIDPVRLPNDGRVPIFRQGGFAVIGNTASITATVSNGQTIDCARVRLSRVRVIGNDGELINTGYTTDLEAGTVTFNNVTGYSQPVTVEHRVEDMAVIGQVDINGTITFTRALTHEYPISGSYVSSALIAGDLFANVGVIFDQATWNNVWADELSGSAATGTYNTALNPILVTNRGAITERWAVVFTNTTQFNLIGENVGVIATGNTSSNLAPLNPATGAPYFTLASAGWGLGWATGNVLRFNTIGAEFPVWVLRTIQQGPETVENDQFTLLIRGDVDQP